MKHVKTALLILIGSLLFPACKAPTSIATISKDCEGVMCTREFRSITVKVVDKQGMPVPLATHITAWLLDKSNFISYQNADSGYTVLDDSFVKYIQKSAGSKFAFVATTTSGKKVSAEFRIGADCCHLFLVSGPRQIVVP